MFRATNFDKLLDKATSNLRLDPDWPTILQICDLIRQNDCSPKYAVTAVKKKLYSQNPHQAMFALLTLESIVKNCGSGIHDEVASKAFCETLRDLVKTTQHENLRSKILELIQAWAFAFRNTPKYRAVQDTVNILKAECFKFPPLKESDAMFSADTAPEWADGEVCHRCRVAFSLMVRRHHCRACGQVFCQQCSSKTSTLPKFGIEKEVRVCDACFDKVSRPPTSTAKLEIVDTSNDYGPTQGQKRPGKSAEELQEEEELQLALALSQSEAEQKEKERKSRTHTIPEPTPHQTLSPTPSSVSASPEHSGAANAELSRYLDRNYWEQRLSRDASAAPTAPASHASHDAQESEYLKPVTNKAQEDDNEDKEIDEFVESLKSQVEIFVNRMKSNSSRGRSIANDTSVQTLFMNITAMHSRLLRYIQQQDDKRVYLESLQDKVSQVRDSRAALDTLRAEHAARLAAAAEAAERQRQLQMAAKLQAMRKKKHEYLQYQRQLALQRVQEQEREMQMRQEQQKHQYMMSAGGGYYVPAVSMHQFQPSGYPNQPVYGKQFHMPGMPQSTTDGTLSMPGQTALSQANVQMNVAQLGTLSQSMPQLPNAYAMSTAAMTQPQVTSQPAINQNVRPNMNPQLSMQSSAMHQLPMQMGLQHILQQNVANGLQGQMQKSNIPNQQTQMMPMGQQNLPPQPINPTNPMLGMQMRMPVMQGSQVHAGYPMNIQNQQNGQQPNLQQPTHVMMSLPGQPSQGIGVSNHVPSTSQNMPQVPQAPNSQGQHLPQNPPVQMSQPMTLQGQAIHQPAQMQGPQMHPQQNQNAAQPGQIPHQGQLSHQLGAQVGQIGHQMPPQMQTGQIPMQHPQQMQGQMPQPGHHLPQGQMQTPQNPQVIASMPQSQQTMQNQQLSQNQQMPQAQGQVLKMQPQNFGNAPPPSGPQQQASQQPQQVQTPVKSEHNNNTAELISFD